jgi:hypothetical protein
MNSNCVSGHLVAFKISVDINTAGVEPCQCDDVCNLLFLHFHHYNFVYYKVLKTFYHTNVSAERVVYSEGIFVFTGCVN